ncbi:MAG: endonuclease III domain-containing protein [Verrucomicrobia bacterium]|nr:MAG: endonuclease III domain-containing protein [Verrucomicrobiota bacterium]
MKPSASPPLRPIYRALLHEFGPQHWWPGRTRLEICVGAILTQNTAWTNVERAIQNLRKARALNLPVLHSATLPQLAAWIRPAGYFNVKARRLRAFTTLVVGEFGGKLEKLLALPATQLRATLLAVKGIGPETADSIVLYAAERPVFVVDAYTRRFLHRHGWISAKATYDEIAALFTAQLPCNVTMFNEYHALIVALGKNFCRPRPLCEKCPLRRWLKD